MYFLESHRSVIFRIPWRAAERPPRICDDFQRFRRESRPASWVDFFQQQKKRIISKNGFEKNDPASWATFSPESQKIGSWRIFFRIELKIYTHLSFESLVHFLGIKENSKERARKPETAYQGQHYKEQTQRTHILCTTFTVPTHKHSATDAHRFE